MTAQTITTPSGERMVVLSETEYEILRAAAEDTADRAAASEFRRLLATGEEELVPDELAGRLLEGENPVRVWREYRGMKASALAGATGLSQPYLSQIETGKREGTVSAMKKIAEVLQVDIDDLV